MAFPKTLDTSDPDAVARFIGGRRALNAQRQFNRFLRLEKLVELWATNPEMKQAQLARALGVSKTTICRDVRVIKELMQQQKSCPVCGSKYRADLRAGFQDHGSDKKLNSN